MPSTDFIKWVAILGIAALVVAAGWYVINLKANLAIAEQNTVTLMEGIDSQQTVIDELEENISKIKNINKDLNKAINTQLAEIRDLRNKFNISANGKSRDFGKITYANPEAIERIINGATKSVDRCYELITGAELKEGERNRECQAYIDSIK